MLLTYTLANGWQHCQLDINNIFLHDILNEAVFLEQPPDFVTHGNSHLVCKLHKALYGLNRLLAHGLTGCLHFLSLLVFNVRRQIHPYCFDTKATSNVIFSFMLMILYLLDLHLLKFLILLLCYTLNLFLRTLVF